MIKEGEAVNRRVEVAACLQRLAPREQLACIDGPRSNIRSAGLHRIIWHANRPALSPRSIARIRLGRDARFPGAEVKRNDALRVGFDARHEEEHVIRGFLSPGRVNKTSISNFSRISLSRPIFWWYRKVPVHLTQPSPCGPHGRPGDNPCGVKNEQEVFMGIWLRAVRPRARWRCVVAVRLSA